MMDEEVALDLQSPRKKVKSVDLTVDESPSQMSTFNGFGFTRVLKEMPDTKSIFLEATFQNNKAVVILEKEAFGELNARHIISSETKINNILQNDIYNTYTAFPQLEHNAIKATVIHPASEKHIEKYSRKNTYMIAETCELYSTVVLPFLKENSFSHQWVYNVLEHKTESERIIFEDVTPDTGFLLIPDMKWSGLDTNVLYVLALPFRKDISSLRDLSTQHLPLLKNIKEKTLKSIEDKYGVKSDLIRSYIHYQPSYYHFHIHFNLITNGVPGTGVEKAHLLDTVIANIELVPDYYQKIALNYVLSEDNPLYKEIVSKS